MTRKPPHDLGQQWDKAGPNDPANKVSRRGSSAELLLAVQLDQAGIPYEREAKFYAHRRWRADFLLPRYILIEVEGGSWVAGRHTRGAGFAADLSKYNKAAELGYTVLRYTPAMIEDGSALEQIRRVIEERKRAAA